MPAVTTLEAAREVEFGDLVQRDPGEPGNDGAVVIRVPKFRATATAAGPVEQFSTVGPDRTP